MVSWTHPQNLWPQIKWIDPLYKLLKVCFIQWNIIQSSKINSVICNNVDEPEGHYGKWNKAVTEGQIPHDSTYMMYLKIVQHIEAENTMMLARSWRSKWGVAVLQVSVMQRGIKSRHLLYRVSNTLSYTSKFVQCRSHVKGFFTII